MAQQSGYLWFLYALLTVGTWGVYGVFLHTGQVGMGDPENGRYKAFLFVGIAYFLTAVLAPLVVLMAKGADWNFPGKGLWWSLFAGIVGAIGAFCVLLAFGAGGHPAVVMSIIFAGAPIVNAIVVFSLHPPEGGLGAVRWQCYVGIVLALVGGFLVTKYKPPPVKKAPPSATVEAAADASE